MKSKCTFILKASLSLVLALLMLFGTMATSIAAAVENAPDAEPESEAHGAEGFFAAVRRHTDLADTGRNVDLAETGNGAMSTFPAGMIVYFNLNSSRWNNPSTVYAYFFTTTGWSSSSSQYTRVTSTKNDDGFFTATVPNDGKTYQAVQFRSANAVNSGNYTNVHNPDYVWNNTVWDNNSGNWDNFTNWGTYNSKKTNSQGKIYFDNSLTQWTGNIYLVVSRATDSWYFRMDKMAADADAPDIYYYSMSSTFGDGYTAIGFANSGSNTMSSNSDGSTAYANAAKKTTWICGYAINNSNSTYVGVPVKSGTDVGYTLTYQSGSYNYFDKTYTLNSGSNGSADIDGYQFTGHGAATANAQATASAGSTTTMAIAKSSTVTVTPHPNSGYKIKNVTLDTANTGTALNDEGDGTYTYKADGSAHTIYVTYEEDNTCTLSLSPNTKQTLAVGETFDITVSSEHCTGSASNLSISSSDSSYVTSTLKSTDTDSRTYTIKAIKPTTSDITLTAACSADSDENNPTIAVQVNAPTISFSDISTQVNRTGSFSASISGNAPAIAGTFSYAIKSGSGITLSGTNNVNWTATAAGTPKITATYTYRNGTNTANLTVTKDITVTVSSPTIQVKYNTGGGAATTTQTMTYNAAATTTVGGTADHLVYKYTLANPTKNTTYYAAITIGGTEYHLTTSGYTDSVPLTGSGSATMTTSGSNWITFTTKNQSASSSGNYNLYFDYVTKKFYIEYPVQVTYDGRCNGTSVKKEYVMIDYGATPSTNRTLTKPTGYTQTSATAWYTNTGCTTSYTAAARTSDLTIYTPFTADQYTVTLDANTNGGTIKKTSGSSPANTATFTHTYGTASTIASQYYSVTPPTGYILDGWYDKASGGTKYTSVGATAISANKTYYAHYTEKKAGATVKAYTNGSASGTGGTVKVGTSGTPGATATITNNTFGFTTYQDVLIATTTAGYTFDGWETGGTYGSHVKLYIDSTCTTEYDKATHGGTYTTIYVKTDGYVDNDMTTANTEVHALFNATQYTITKENRYYTNDSPVIGSATTGGDLVISAAAGGTYDYGETITLTATAASGYAVDMIEMSYDGGTTWETVVTSPTAAAATAATTTMSNTTFTLQNTTSNTYKFRATFRKVYSLTFYTSWKQDAGGNWQRATAAPRTIKITNPYDVTKTFTYTYDNSAAKGEEEVINSVSDTTYSEGNMIQVLAGYKIEATYSALASSEVIRGVNYSNSRRYSTEEEPDNLYLNRVNQTGTGTLVDPEDPTKGYTAGDDDFGKAGHRYSFTSGVNGDTIYAYAMFYDTAEAALISANYATYVTNKTGSGLDQDTHTLTFFVDQNYWNIDVELASKKQIVFSDTKNTVIVSQHTDNYYSIGEEGVSIPVAAKASSTQTNVINSANVHFYKATDAGAKGDALTDAEITACGIAISSGTSTSSSAANGSNLTITATAMPAYNIYVDLGLTVSYAVKLDSKMQSDTFVHKTKFNQVANIAIKTDADAGTNLLAQAQNDTAASTQGPTSVTSGNTIYLTNTIVNAWKDYYIFIGWYKGKTSDPSQIDFENGLISRNANFTYKPTANCTIYAVGTRDLFINGSRYITGKGSDWYKEDLDNDGTVENDEWVNQRMEFDPTLGTGGMYYWTITDDMYSTAGYFRTYSTNDWGTEDDNIGYYKASGGNYYWAGYSGDSKHGRGFFQIIDTAKGYEHRTLWSGIGSFVDGSHTTTYGTTYGKVYNRDSNSLTDAQGFIDFEDTESRYPGFSSPITIYYDPNGATDATKLMVKATPVYPHIYLSNGYQNIDQATPSDISIQVNGGTSHANNVSSDAVFDEAGKKCKYVGAGWSPRCEGTVRDIQIREKNAKVKITKTVASGYKVSCFVVYDLKDSVTSVVPTKVDDTTYYCEIQMDGDQSYYICPVVEKTTADVTIVVDSTQMDTVEWGDLIGCYAWYKTASGTAAAYGDYPGQLMVPSADGMSWSASFPSQDASGNKLVGITFSNYYDGANTWLGGTNVLGTVTTEGSDGSGNIIPTYNKIVKANSDYNKTNCKAQTYDYREPVAYYINKDEGDMLLTFALKKGNGELITWTHTDLVTTTDIRESIGAASYPLDFEYLTDMNGHYITMNGTSLGDSKPTPSFYVCAKGQAIYANNAMTHIFWSGKQYQTPTSSVPAGKGGYGDQIIYNGYNHYTANEINMDYAVQWYVYDASGRYITSMLSAGFADKDATETTMTRIAAELDRMGYGTSGRSVAICYDQSRYCYGKSGNIANTDSNFNAYRFTGQWHMENAYATAKVTAKVGMMTDNGEVIKDTSSSTFGTASVAIETTKLKHYDSAEQYGTGSTTGADGTVYYAYTTIVDGKNQPITLTASLANFKGWYYYDADDKLQLASEDRVFTPSYSKDVTYYAIFSANAIYQYVYTGREGGVKSKSYGTSGGSLSDYELTHGNVIQKTTGDHARTDFGSASKMPGANAVSLFKKTISWNSTVTDAMLTADPLGYVMNIDNATITPQSFTLTYHYPGSKGAASTSTGSTTKQYNQLVNLQLGIQTLAADDKVFVGWYEANASGVSTGRLLSTAPNFGQVIVKDTHIVAVYGDADLTSDGTWEVYIDDKAVTREMYTADSGTYYNDVIVCARQNNTTKTELPSGAVVGALFVDDNGTNNTISTANLSKFANALSANSGKSGKSNGCTVTNVFTDTVTSFGRADIAVRADYALSKGHKYYVYAYVKVGGTYYFDLTNAAVTTDNTYPTYVVG